MTLIYLIAGEQSGDVLGGRLMRALAAARPDVTFAGVGGENMRDAGLNSLFPMNELALMGLVEVLPRILSLKRRIAETIADITARRPALVVTIDSPGFTMRVLKAIAPLAIPRVHYVAPQIWGWRESRVRRYPGLFDELLCLLPFEPEFFARHGVQARFVGHPVLESGADQGDAGRFRAKFNIPATARILTVMPGSRRTETARLLPIFGDAIAQLRRDVPDLLPVVPVADTVAAQVIAASQHWPVRPVIVTDSCDKFDAFAASQAGMIKSGTSTLEVALAGVPMVVAYTFGKLTNALARKILKVKYASIINLLADRAVLPECLLSDCTADNIASTLLPLLTNPAAARAQREAAFAMLAKLRPAEGLPSVAAAQVIVRKLPEHP
jgi:lipid-A-disaccharide synthase